MDLFKHKDCSKDQENLQRLSRIAKIFAMRAYGEQAVLFPEVDELSGKITFQVRHGITATLLDNYYFADLQDSLNRFLDLLVLKRQMNATKA